MDKLSSLTARRNELLSSGAEIRKKIAELIDDESFVESDSFAFSRNEFYGEDVAGNGVVTGFATVNDYPVYLVGINSQILSGGLTEAGCGKIVRCLEKALKVSAPVIYLLSSKGVVAGEGVACLEGVAKVLSVMEELKGEVPQFVVNMGDVLGQASLFTAFADYSYFMKGACVAYGSPLVIAAKSGKSADAAAVGGAAAAKATGICSFEVADLTEVRQSVSDILDILPMFGGISLETEDDPNRSAPSLNEKACAGCLIKAVFDDGKAVELNEGFAKEVKTVIGRIGGYSAAALIFDGKEGVELTSANVEKIKEFMYYCEENNLPVVTFVNTLGIVNDMATAQSTVLRNMTYLVSALKADVARVNVIYGKATGLGYTLFASKAFGAAYSYAFATAKIALFDSNVGAELEVVAKGGDYDEIKDRYEQNEMDAFNAAKNGYVDNVIEPEFVRQYVISALQMLV